MPHTRESFLERYPEFGHVPPGALDGQLDDALLTLSRSAWGKYYDRAQALWTAHYLALRFDLAKACAELGIRNPCDMGTITSMSASTGSLSVSKSLSKLLGADDPTVADFARTSYGMEYLDLAFAVIPVGSVVYSPDTSDTQRYWT